MVLQLVKNFFLNRNLLSESEVFARAQDCSFPIHLYDAAKIMVFIVPEHNAMSGGIYSIFSIAKHVRRLKRYHNFEVIVMTRPTPSNLTYFRNANFVNSENVYRFEQILLCKSAEEIYLQIPEYASEFFLDYLSSAELSYLKSRKKIYVNLLNQNIRLMPEKEKFSNLFAISDEISQSVAHHAYFSQAMANKYNLPTLLLPAYTDLSDYPPADFSEKENLIIYSLDDAPQKQRCLKRIAKDLPKFKLVEIRDITFDRFMDYASRCLFSITFGEGFDGYLAQPIHQGGIGFAVFNEEFFPSPRFKKYYNIFSDENEMVEDICSRIQSLASNRDAYVRLNKQFQEEYRRLYSYEEYIEQIKKLSLRKFEIYPRLPAS